MAASRVARICKYLLYFANDHLDFKLAELRSLASIFGDQVKVMDDSYDKKCPFLVIEADAEEHIHQILTRSVLIRSAFELWAEGSSQAELYAGLRQLPQDFLTPFLCKDKTFRIQVESFNKTLKQQEKLERIEALPTDVLDFQGHVKLTDPDMVFYLLEYYGHVGCDSSERPLAVYFGRWIGDGQRSQIHRLHLQKRRFIGNTSMDATLSLIMSNLCCIRTNSLVLDPFVGTGSLLVACAHHGSYVMGTDIDYRLLHALAKPSRNNQKVRDRSESIYANLLQYGLEGRYVDVLVGDTARHFSLWRRQPFLDAIITDPPYGIREQTKKLGSNKTETIIDEIYKVGHIPQRISYQLSDIYHDLLNFAAVFLNLNGRLVFWLPVFRSEYCEENIPQHPCLHLVHNCEQVLNSKVSRRLIIMEKTVPFSDTAEAARASVKVDHFEQATFRERYFSQV